MFTDLWKTASKSLMEALCKCTRHAQLCPVAHSTVTQQDDAEIINTRFAPEWCVGHRKQTGTQHHQSVDSKFAHVYGKSHRVIAAEPMVHCATMIKRTPNRISKKWCCHLNHYCFGMVRGTVEHENAHQYVNSPPQVVVTKCEDLRQFHHSDGVLVTSTCNASEWCMTHVESHGTHDHPHLDQSWTNQHPNGHWSALCERKRRNSTVNVVNNPILILQGGAIIPQRIAPEWCVVALTTNCSTSLSINGHNLHMFIEKATRLRQND